MAKVCSKLYLTESGDEVKRLDPNAAIATLAFQFADGESRQVNLGEFPADIRDCFAWHGLSQKLGDSYASKQGNDAVEAFDDVLDALRNGTWLQKGESAGPRTTDLALALHRLKPEKYPELVDAAARVAEMSAEEKKAAQNLAVVEHAILEIRAERAAKKKAELEAKISSGDGGLDAL